MAEELTKYLTRMDVKCRYIHSDVTTIDRLKLLDEFRDGVFNVLIGVNLLREGLDLPQVAPRHNNGCRQRGFSTLSQVSDADCRTRST